MWRLKGSEHVCFGAEGIRTDLDIRILMLRFANENAKTACKMQLSQ